jgi:hypothetical protein
MTPPRTPSPSGDGATGTSFPDQWSIWREAVVLLSEQSAWRGESDSHVRSELVEPSRSLSGHLPVAGVVERPA